MLHRPLGSFAFAVEKDYRRLRLLNSTSVNITCPSRSDRHNTTVDRPTSKGWVALLAGRLRSLHVHAWVGLRAGWPCAWDYGSVAGRWLVGGLWVVRQGAWKRVGR